MKNIPCRLVVIEQVYHQVVGAQPTSVESRFTRILTSDEQPFSRRTKVGEEWQPLDTGWLKDCVGMLVVTNNEGENPQTIPAEEEKAAIAKKLLVIAFGIDAIGIAVRPGESARFEPLYVNQMRIRCCSGTAKYTINAYPR